MKKLLLLALAPMTLIGALSLRAPASAPVPVPAPASTLDGYVVMNADATPFSTAFDADKGKVRLVMYVSPTCGGCLLGARDMQEEVLEKIPDANLEAYVVWAPKNGGREKHLDRVTRLVTDERATQYWDAHAAVSTPYDRLFDLAGPCAGVFALYGPDAEWNLESPPEPVVWQDAHADQRGREDNPEVDAEAMADAVRTLLEGIERS